MTGGDLAPDRADRGYGIPTQALCLAHIQHAARRWSEGPPVDLLFQSVAGARRRTTRGRRQASPRP